MGRELKQKEQTLSSSKLSWEAVSVRGVPNFPGPAGRDRLFATTLLQTLEKSRQSTIPFLEITPNLLFQELNKSSPPKCPPLKLPLPLSQPYFQVNLPKAAWGNAWDHSAGALPKTALRCQSGICYRSAGPERKSSPARFRSCQPGMKEYIIFFGHKTIF